MIFEESVVLARPFEEVVPQVRDALASQGPHPAFYVYQYPVVYMRCN